MNPPDLGLLTYVPLVKHRDDPTLFILTGDLNYFSEA